MAAFELACGLWQGANWASNELTGQGLKDHAVDLLKSFVSEDFTSWFEKKFSKLKKDQTHKVMELVNQLRMFQTSTLDNINPRDLDGNCGLKTQLVDLLRVICEGVAALSATRDSEGFEKLVSHFIADLGMSLQMFGIAQNQGLSSKMDRLSYTQEETPPADARLLCVGNPGSGKSTLLNTIVGMVLFRSGVSDVNLGAGITDYVKWVYHLGVMYGDTPGLNDKTNRVRAAQQIAEGLKAGGVYRLVFFVTLDNRASPLAEDMATMKIILEAINDPNLDYGIIVNKVAAKMAKKLQGDLRDQLLSQLNNHGCRSTTTRVLLYKRDDELEDENNTLSETPQPDLFPFIRGLPWQSFSKVVELEMAQYQEHVREMENRLAQQGRELAELKNRQVTLWRVQMPRKKGDDLTYFPNLSIHTENLSLSLPPPPPPPELWIVSGFPSAGTHFPLPPSFIPVLPSLPS
jgi:energy-coupling factor transporter ATP-binding protein EcfA2